MKRKNCARGASYKKIVLDKLTQFIGSGNHGKPACSVETGLNYITSHLT